MSRRSVVTEQEVFDAANQLRMTGKQVTALKILTVLGGGSLTTIYKHLDAWEARERFDKQSIPSPAESSDELPPSVIEALRGIWKVAVEEAEQRVANTQRAEIEALRAQIKALNVQLSQVRKANK